MQGLLGTVASGLDKRDKGLLRGRVGYGELVRALQDSLDVGQSLTLGCHQAAVRKVQRAAVVHRFHLELSHRPRAQHLQRKRITERTPAAPDQGPERGIFTEMLHRNGLEAASARAAVDSGVTLDVSDWELQGIEYVVTFRRRTLHRQQAPPAPSSTLMSLLPSSVRGPRRPPLLAMDVRQVDTCLLMESLIRWLRLGRRESCRLVSVEVDGAMLGALSRRLGVLSSRLLVSTDICENSMPEKEGAAMSGVVWKDMALSDTARVTDTAPVEASWL